MELDRPKFENFKPGNYPLGEQFDVFELKFDGIWGQLLLEGDTWQVWSRNGLLKRHGKLQGKWLRTLLHSEFLYASEWSKDRPDIYNKLAVFDAEMINGITLEKFSNGEAREVLAATVNELQAQGENIVSGLFLVDQYPIIQAPKVWEEMVVKHKFEGLVFKNSQAPWGSPFGRMKASYTMDYVCMGFLDSDSDTYAGWGVASILGGLYKDGKLERSCKVSGLTDYWRAEFYKNRGKYIGLVFEAEGKKISKKGALRHPNFLKVRDDKPSEDCKWPS